MYRSTSPSVAAHTARHQMFIVCGIECSSWRTAVTRGEAAGIAGEPAIEIF